MISSPPPPSLAVFLSAAFLLASALSIPAGSAHAGGGKSQNKEESRDIVGDCRSNWEQSAAAQVCDNETFSKTNDDQCEIRAFCDDDKGVSALSLVWVDPDDADDLENCNGQLKLSC